MSFSLRTLGVSSLRSEKRIDTVAMLPVFLLPFSFGLIAHDIRSPPSHHLQYRGRCSVDFLRSRSSARVFTSCFECVDRVPTFGAVRRTPIQCTTTAVASTLPFRSSQCKINDLIYIDPPPTECSSEDDGEVLQKPKKFYSTVFPEKGRCHCARSIVADEQSAK